jgi:sulfur-oxidizing protein SoxY
MSTRREMLGRSAGVAAVLAGLGLLPAGAQAAYAAAAFTARTTADLTRALGISTPVESREVTITGPDIAENGAVVPLGCATALPGVQRMLLLVEQNPAVLCAAFDVTEAVEVRFNTRVKMAQSSGVVVVAVLNDGQVLFARKDVQITLGGCGG